MRVYILRGREGHQFMSNLPPCRVEEVPPFYHSGIDVFGPFVVSDRKATRGTRGTIKVWGLLITCMISRAIHVEPLNGLDTSSLKNSLRRFLAIRGACKNLYSDRGTNFISSDSQDSLNINQIKDELQVKECTWHFNAPHASHHGGAWERKIGAVRRVLDASLLNLKGNVLNRDEFGTLLYEAMSIVNNTPLWEVSNDPTDPAPISPAMILTGKDNPNPPPLTSFTNSDLVSYGKLRWKKVQYISECFWEQWRKHYLSSLIQRRKWQFKTRNFQINDIVLLKDKNVKRNQWCTGIIKEVYPGRDGLVRSVSVEITVNNKKRQYLRPICDIVLIVANNS